MKRLRHIITVILLCQVLVLFAETLELVTLESAPAEFSVNGKAQGINVELATEALKRMGYDTEIIFVNWNRAIEMVKKGQADAIIDAAYNDARSKFLLYPKEHIYVEEWYDKETGRKVPERKVIFPLSLT